MPHYPITGMHSHRHPFLGVGEFEIQQALAADVAAPEAKTSIAIPVVSGAVSGLLVWSLARAFAVQPKKAMQVGFVWGGVTVAYSFISGWLLSEFNQLQNVQVPVPTNPTE